MPFHAIEYLEAAALQYPEKIAFSDENTALTFRELLLCSQICANQIAEKTDRINSPIAVLCDRSIFSVISFMGVLLSGNYYAPLDINMPAVRLKRILDNLSPSLIIFAEPPGKDVKDVTAEIPSLTVGEGILHQNCPLHGGEKQYKEVIDADPAYVIYTSGSTGYPKGIVVSHRALIDFTKWMTSNLEITSSDIFANQAPFYFDLSIKNIYPPIAMGAKSVLIPKKLFMFPTRLIDYLNEKRANTLIWSTSAFHLVANSGILEKKILESLEKVAVGGETLYAKQLNIWRKQMPDVTYFNYYGPTETTVDCTYYKIEREFADGETIPIGKACENKQVLLLDDELKVPPMGEVGEICVRGSGISGGYFGDAEKTAAAFIQNPLNTKYPDIIYKTGDLAKINEAGELIFVSRGDYQIKHMGYRIELTEIEKAVLTLDEIKNCVCLFDRAKDAIVCVYEGKPDSKAIVVHLRKQLPKYMFPNAFHQVETMPYNANGKIDRRALKESYENGKNHRD